MLVTPTVRVWAAAEVPAEAWSWALPRRNQVTLWELLAALCGVQWFLQQANTAALHTLLRGSSRQVDFNSVLGSVWFDLARANVLMHAHYVPSALNLADGPTRASKADKSRAALESLRFKEVAWQWPVGAPWRQ